MHTDARILCGRLQCRCTVMFNPLQVERVAFDFFVGHFVVDYSDRHYCRRSFKCGWTPHNIILPGNMFFGPSSFMHQDPPTLHDLCFMQWQHTSSIAQSNL